MCGRYTLRTPASVIASHFQLGLFDPDSLTPRFNIAPTQNIAAVRVNSASGSREIVNLRWGLIPSWADDPSISARMINARGETVATKPSFRAAFKKRRCLVPADGYYEWRRDGKSKTPFHIRRPDGGVFALAAIWETWEREGRRIESCAFLTTSPNPALAAIHDRMPVILSPADFSTWLDPEISKPDALEPLIRACPDETLTASAVSTWVNSPTHDDERCVTPV